MNVAVCLSSDAVATVGENSSLAVRASAPVISIAKQLVGAGVPSSLPMEVFR
jgi:hypothetical protein